MNVRRLKDNNFTNFSIFHFLKAPQRFPYHVTSQKQEIDAQHSMTPEFINNYFTINLFIYY